MKISHNNFKTNPLTFDHNLCSLPVKMFFLTGLWASVNQAQETSYLSVLWLPGWREKPHTLETPSKGLPCYCKKNIPYVYVQYVYYLKLNYKHMKSAQLMPSFLNKWHLDWCGISVQIFATLFDYWELNLIYNAWNRHTLNRHTPT